MKLFITSILTLFSIIPVFSGEHRTTEIDKVDKFKLELEEWVNGE